MNQVFLAALDKALQLDPQNFRARLRKAENCLERPKNYGGNRELGFRILMELYRERPENSRVIYYLSQYYRLKEDFHLYREYLQKARSLNPRELKAIWELSELEIEDNQLTIRKIRIGNKTRTSQRLLKRKLDPFIGQVFTREVRDQITKRLTSLHPIDDVTCFYKEENGGLHIDCMITEDITSIFNVMLGLNISLDSTRDINWFVGEAPSAVFASFYYETDNFFGTGDLFSISSMAVYNDIRYRHYTPYPDFHFRLECNVMPTPKYWYHDGRLSFPETYKSIFVLDEFGVGKSFEFADLFLVQEIKKEFYTETYNSFRAPKEVITSAAFVDASFKYIAYRDTFWLMDGFQLQIRPKIITKPGHTDWGPDANPFTHNKGPMFKLYGRFGIYKCLFKTIQFREDIFYLYSYNPFQSELFPIGKDSLTDPFSMKLRGFYQEEFVTRHALVTDTFLSFPLFPDKVRMGWFYDNAVLFDNIATRGIRYLHGIGSHLLIKLPWNLEFVLQGAIGLNAVRQQRFGVEIDWYISRLFVR